MTDLDVQAITDGDVTLLVPERDEPEPEVSIVIPALNEALTIEDFVAWCHKGLADAGVKGEILIVDSSTDETSELALAGGARVLRTPKRGLGRAYIDALPYVRGRYVIMGDADCTYDFRRLHEVRRAVPRGLRVRDGLAVEGLDRGRVHARPAPVLRHPFTTWILNRVYGSRFSDIHCGMRGITRTPWHCMDITSQSWEYASEMVLKSVHMHLRTARCRSPEGSRGPPQPSQARRLVLPFQAAWINLRAMFVYGSDFFLLKPGRSWLCSVCCWSCPSASATSTSARWPCRCTGSSWG